MPPPEDDAVDDDVVDAVVEVAAGLASAFPVRVRGRLRTRYLQSS